MVAPALDRYTQDRLLGEVWMRPGLSPRDRSLVTLAALIGRNQTIALSDHLKLALSTDRALEIYRSMRSHSSIEPGTIFASYKELYRCFHAGGCLPLISLTC